MDSPKERPLVTFYVVAYKQARFVREAVEGALAQTYSPLEIILSDDCSTDGTFEVMQDAIKGYAGPHTVVLNRNTHNLGVSAHVNKIVELAHGELIVASDGDDVSLPHRTERCVDVWLKAGRPAAIASSVTGIDAAGNPSTSRDLGQFFAEFLPIEGETPVASLLRFAKEGSPRLVSCSGAWTKQLCDAFGPMSPDVWHEDGLITLRAWLLDRIVLVPEALVRYREHDSNIWNRVKTPLTSVNARQDAEEDRRTHARHCRESLLSYLPDLDLALRKQFITRPLYDEVKVRVETACRFHQVIEDWWTVGWITRVKWLVFLAWHRQMNDARWCGPRLLPFPVFLSLGAAWGLLRHGGRLRS